MSLRLYRLLVRFYPQGFREKYGPELVEAFAARRRSRTMGFVRFWIFHLKDFVLSLVREHADARHKPRAKKRIMLEEWIMSVLLQDLKYALRVIRNNPGFAAIVIVTLGLGIGFNTAIFSVANGVLLRPLPYEEADRLMWGFSTFSGAANASVSPPDFLDYREQNTVFENLAARRGAQSYALTGLGAPEQIRGQTVSVGFFETLGAGPVAGRSFRANEEMSASSRVVVLSNGFWQRAFGGERDALGKTLTLDGTTYDIVGVMPPGFRLFNSVDFWRPLAFDQASNMIRRFHNVRLVGRLRPGVTIEAAQAELDVISRQLEEQYPVSNPTWRLVITPLKEILVGTIRPALLMLLGAVTLVLFIACSNVANLLLARGATRRAEIGVRAALGAGRMRVVHQLLVENMTLGLIGGGVGLGVAYAGVKVLRQLDPQNLPRLQEVSVDWRVLLFALGLSIASALVFGLFPAIVASRADAISSVSRGGRSSETGGGKIRAALVSTQVALTFMLLVGSGLLIRSFGRLTSVEPGFETDQLLAAALSLPPARYETDESQRIFFETVQQRVEAVSGVDGVGWIDVLPMGGSGNDTYLAVPGRHQLGTETQFNAQTRAVSDNYFEVMGIPLVRGRQFSNVDRDGSPAVVIIDEPFAQAIFPEEDPIGQRIRMDFGEVYEAEIVGVVGGVSQFSLARGLSLTFYLPSGQVMQSNNTVVVRTSVEPEVLVRTISRIVAEIDPLQPVARMTTAHDLLEQSVAQPRFQMLLLGLFATVALVLSAIGIYGVLGYYVAQRRREVGLRVALGAQKRDVYRLVLGRGLAYTAIGLVVGLVGAIALSRFMANLLFGVTPTDPLTLIVVPIILGVVAVTSGYLPARRALGIDPMVALRET